MLKKYYFRKTGSITIYFIISLLTSLNLHASDMSLSMFEASFSLLKKGAIVGDVEVSLVKDDNDEYIYKSYSKTTGLVSLFYKLESSEESRFQLAENKLRAIKYTRHRIKKKKELNIETSFDWEKMQATNIENGINSLIKLESGMLDKLNYQIQLMRDLKSSIHPVTYHIIDSNKIKTYNFTFLGKENIETPMGQFETLKFIIQKPGDKRKSIIWCADKFDYLPIRIDSIEKDGGTTTAIIKKYNND